MTDREVMQQALDALERYQVKRQDFDRFVDEVTALRTALDAAPQPEPVAWRVQRPTDRRWTLCTSYSDAVRLGRCYIPTSYPQPLYTAPPAAQPDRGESLASMYISLCDAIGYSPAKDDRLHSPEEWAAYLHTHYVKTQKEAVTDAMVEAACVEYDTLGPTADRGVMHAALVAAMNAAKEDV